MSSRRKNAEITGLGWFFFCFLKIAILFFQPSVPFAADGSGDGAGWGESFGFGTDIAFTVYKTREDICPQWSITHRSRILVLRSRPVLSLQMQRVEMVMRNPALPPPCRLPHLQSTMAPFAHGLLLLVQTYECFSTTNGHLLALFLRMDAAGQQDLSSSQKHATAWAKSWCFTPLRSQPWRTSPFADTGSLSFFQEQPSEMADSFFIRIRCHCRWHHPTS